MRRERAVPRRDPDIDAANSTDFLPAISNRTCYFAGLDFCTVSLQTAAKDQYVLVLPDATNGPRELEVTPSFVKTDGDGNFPLKLACSNPPFFLSKNQVVARTKIYPFQEILSDLPVVFWTEEIGKNRPILSCRLVSKGSDISLTGMLDTGADVTVVSSSNWPSSWEKQSVAGTIRGVGGYIPAERSKNVIQIEGPDGQIASVRPFVINSGFSLWGRDVMSQWGTRIELAPKIRDF